MPIPLLLLLLLLPEQIPERSQVNLCCFLLVLTRHIPIHDSHRLFLKGLSNKEAPKGDHRSSVICQPESPRLRDPPFQPPQSTNPFFSGGSCVILHVRIFTLFIREYPASTAINSYKKHRIREKKKEKRAWPNSQSTDSQWVSSISSSLVSQRTFRSSKHTSSVSLGLQSSIPISCFFANHDAPSSELEIYRLEQRYTRRTKRTGFSSGAAYVDGEYVYPDSHNSSEVSSPVSLSKNSTGSAEREFWRAPGSVTTTISANADAYSNASRSPTSPEFGSQQKQQQQVMFRSEQTSGSNAGADPSARR